MQCEFFYVVGLCKYGDACSRQHLNLAGPTRIVVLPNAAPFTALEKLNARLLRQSMAEVLEFALRFGKVLDFAIAANKNHLYGSIYVEFATLYAAQEFKLNFPKIMGGNDIFVRYLDIPSLRCALCKDEDCSDYFCQKVHERFFEQNELLETRPKRA